MSRVCGIGFFGRNQNRSEYRVLLRVFGGNRREIAYRSAARAGTVLLRYAARSFSVGGQGGILLQVTLLSHTPEPEKVVAAAAKLCYSASDVQSLMDNLTPDAVEHFVHTLASFGHESPIEHVSFTFGIEGISRACSHQLVRHRIASYSQKSQRYVGETDFDYVIPPAVVEDEEALRCFREAMRNANEAYARISDRLERRHAQELISRGTEPAAAHKAARKQAMEDARFVLPNACETKIVVTMNARTLLHFFRQRCCRRAQWEIRAVADEMLRLCREVSPVLFAKAGPACVCGPCPEGAMSCGRADEMRARYAGEKKNG